MKAPSWARFAVTALAAGLVTACPLNQAGVNTTTTVILKALAVTGKEDSRVVPRVYLKWNEVPGAAKYELNTTGSNKPLVSSSGTSFEDSTGVREGDTFSYFVRALDPANGPKTQSDTLTVKILAHDVATPPVPTVGPEESGRVTSLEPTITWGAVPGATGYYVKVFQVGDSSTLVFAALTEFTSIQVGKLPLKSLEWPTQRFMQMGENTKLTAGKDYRVELVALKADTATLEKAVAVDVSDKAVARPFVEP